MSTLPLQFNASQWGFLIINYVYRNVCAEIDIFFNWNILFFLLLCFAASWKFCVPPTSLEVLPHNPHFVQDLLFT